MSSQGKRLEQAPTDLPQWRKDRIAKLVEGYEETLIALGKK